MCGEAGAEESDEHVLFHGSSVEAVVELGDIPSEVFALDPVVGSEQEPLQVGQRDMDQGRALWAVGPAWTTRWRCG